MVFPYAAKISAKFQSKKNQTFSPPPPPPITTVSNTGTKLDDIDKRIDKPIVIDD